MEEKYLLYDSINTTAVRWLTLYQRDQCKEIGILKFNNSVTHLWFLKMLENYRIFNNYSSYYINCNFWEYLRLRYIKKFKGLRRVKKNQNIALIDADVFIDELTTAFQVDVSIIGEIYEKYWSR